ncbi:MAG: UPF0758 domain-containing protein [Mucilaginibacter sp.]
MELVKGPKRIKAIAEYGLPLEKLHALGAGTLSNAELLAILLCTGSRELSVLYLCQGIMQSVKNESSRLLHKTANDFCKFPWIGAAKAAILLAAIELGRRTFAALP